MDGPAIMIAVAMVAAGALATLVGLGVAGLFWQAGPGEPATDVTPEQPPARIPHQRRPGAGRSALVSHRMRLSAQAAEASRRAAQARTEAPAAREAATTAQAARDEAWRAVEAVDELPAPATLAAPASVDPTVTHAAFAAFRRGELTADELRKVWSSPEENDPERADQERQRRRRLALTRATRQAYEQAAAVARRADEEARVAEIAADALTAEAAEAAREATAVTTIR